MKNILKKLLNLFKGKPKNKTNITIETKEEKINLSSINTELLQLIFDFLIKERRDGNFDLEKAYEKNKNLIENFLQSKFKNKLSIEEINHFLKLIKNELMQEKSHFWDVEYYLDNVKYLKYPLDNTLNLLTKENIKNVKSDNLFIDLKTNHKKIISIIKNIKDEEQKKLFLNVWNEGIKNFIKSNNFSSIQFSPEEEEIGFLLDKNYTKNLLVDKINTSQFIFYKNNYVKLIDYLKTLNLSTLKFKWGNAHKLIFLNRFNVNYFLKMDLIVFSKELEPIIEKVILDFDDFINK